MTTEKQFVVLDLSAQGEAKRKQIFTSSNILKPGLSLRFLEQTADQLSAVKENPITLLSTKSFQEKVDCIFLPTTMSDSLIQVASVISEEVKEMGFVDCILLQNSKNWLRCFLAQALRQSIIDEHSTLNTHQAAFVTDGGAWTHLCCSLLMQMGFKNIVILSEDVDSSQSKFKSTQAKYFGSQISYLSFDKLTEQPSHASVLINLLDSTEKPELYGDLLYLNFLKRDSLVIDLFSDQVTSALTEESVVAGVHSFTGLLVLALRDFYVLEHITGGQLAVGQDQFRKHYLS
jgi:hypothetical protein